MDHPNMTHRPEMLAALALALGAALTDLKDRRVPNRLVLAGAIAGLSINAWVSHGAGVGRSVVGGATGLLVFLPFFLLRGMGGGDVKLMGALGACMGFVPILQTALVGSIAGAVLAVSTAIRHGALGRTLANTGRLLGGWVTRGPRPSKDLTLDNPLTLKIPYAVPIAAGVLFIFLMET